jgi:hypothetical protein
MTQLKHQEAAVLAQLQGVDHYLADAGVAWRIWAVRRRAVQFHIVLDHCGVELNRCRSGGSYELVARGSADLVQLIWDHELDWH